MFFSYISTKRCSEQCARELHEVCCSDPVLGLLPILEIYFCNSYFSADPNGAVWCYVDSLSSTCRDLQPSKRFPNNPWSYEACTTPPRDSPLCSGMPVCKGHNCQPPHYPPVILCKHIGGCFNGPINHPPQHC